MRKGSALLIVLGMLSFMVISAVSFSMYMRQSRLPSSYLRRNISARHLVRASLARAIEELEGDFNTNENWGKYDLTETDVSERFYGIYDDPYPGCGTDAQYDVSRNGDFWFRRVFMPFGPTKYAECTVPTLTLEGLAYLPPAIADDVRKFSRYTRTASWRSLPYEAGRYAYVAVNVSDLFDINRLCAAERRDSGLGRISPMTLCSKSREDPFDIDTGKAQQMHTLFEKWTSSSYDSPFVSLADFNLLAGKGSGFAPFMDYIGKTSTTLLKQGNTDTANALFITDTWFPASSVASSTSSSGGGTGAKGQQGSSASSSSSVTYDLAGAHQPFKEFTARQFSQVLNCRNTTDNVGTIFEKSLGLGLVALYDYLDGNQKPISLALPTVEAVPMIAGISCPALLKPEVEDRDKDEIVIKIPNPNATDENGEPKEWQIKRSWSRQTITGFGRVQVKTLLTYPFKRMVTTKRYASNRFKVRGVLRVFAAPANMGCRPTGDNLVLYPAQDAWVSGGKVKEGVASFMSDEKPITAFAKDIEQTDDAIDDSTVLTFECRNIDMPVLYNVREECTNGKGPEDFESKTYLSLDGLKNNTATFRPLTADGAVDGTWSRLTAKTQFEGKTEALNAVTDSLGGFDGSYKLYAALWLQVRDDNNDVVDMVPASIADDIEWLGANTTANAANMRKCGGGTPLISFCADYDVKFNDKIKECFQAQATYPDWKTLYAVDPRYNFAPEDWFCQNGNTTVSKSDWKTALGLDSTSTVLGQNGRDRDIFMFVSDQEYLQDIGELQFLPVMEDMEGGNGSFLSGDYSPDFHGKSFSTRTSPTTGAFANGGRFWRTYTAYDNGDGTDPIYELTSSKIRFYSGIGGFRLNPYSQDNRVMAAAMVGTPFDYYVASTNSNQKAQGARQNTLIGSINLTQALSTFSFGESSLAKMDPDDLLSIMDEIRGVFDEKAKAGNRDWVSAWNSLEWQCLEHAGQINDNNTHFILEENLKGSALHQVDRKFLYSYWRECFDNRQQLFLVFVRAEPQSASGGTIGRNLPSSQLGGRAVALVWRDPNIPSYAKSGTRKNRNQMSSAEETMDNREAVAPHRTRILFYHQFE